MLGPSTQDQVLVEFILLKFDALVEILDGTDSETANTELAVDGSNSLIQLVIHCCGTMRRWSSSVNLGIEVPRDREAEFRAHMPVAEALESAVRTRAAFLDDVAITDFNAPPIAVPVGREAFWTGSCRNVLLHVFEELTQHLGQAEVTRDLLTASQKAT